VPRGADWLDWVNRPLTEAELTALRTSVNRGMPFGDDRRQQRTAARLGLEATLRPRGRPRKSDEK
jgi:putative transposase